MNEGGGAGNMKIDKVKEAASLLFQQLQTIKSNTDTTVKLAILPFSSDDIEFLSNPNGRIWHTDISTLNYAIRQIVPSGRTPLWDAVNRALEELNLNRDIL